MHILRLVENDIFTSGTYMKIGLKWAGLNWIYIDIKKKGEKQQQPRELLLFFSIGTGSFFFFFPSMRGKGRIKKEYQMIQFMILFFLFYCVGGYGEVVCRDFHQQFCNCLPFLIFILFG